jgi:hypothetical protein
MKTEDYYKTINEASEVEPMVDTVFQMVEKHFKSPIVDNKKRRDFIIEMAEVISLAIYDAEKRIEDRLL